MNLFLVGAAGAGAFLLVKAAKTAPAPSPIPPQKPAPLPDPPSTTETGGTNGQPPAGAQCATCVDSPTPKAPAPTPKTTQPSAPITSEPAPHVSSGAILTARTYEQVAYRTSYLDGAYSTTTVKTGSTTGGYNGIA